MKEVGTEVKDSQTATSAADQRPMKLEHDMVELQTHNATIHTWVQKAGRRMSQQDEKLSQLATTIPQQQAMTASFGNIKEEIAS